MTFRITQSISTLALAIALIAAPLSAQVLWQTAAPNTEASTTAFRCYDLGTLTFCVSVHGNIVSLKAPKTGLEHIGIAPVREGYVVCATMSNGFTQVSYDTANAESGFIGSPTIIEPNPFNLPLTIIRTTVSNLKVTQVFTANAADREVLITTTIQNPNFDSRYVRFDRYFDGDLAGTAGGDIYSRPPMPSGARRAFTLLC